MLIEMQMRTMWLTLLSSTALLLLAATPSLASNSGAESTAAAGNMNGGEYKIANSETFSTNYDHDASSHDGVEYFEVYSPVIRTLYSEVFWRMQDPVPLPLSIRERFENGTMAIVGYEVDQVQKSKNQEDGKDVPVPITWAYNHHYIVHLLNSRKAKLVKKRGTRLGMNHGSPEYWTGILLDEEEKETRPVDRSSAIPYVQIFSEGNGGEFRKSFHGYPKGYAQLIHAPDTFQANPMQIDTWNRNTQKANLLPGGPLPSSSKIPQSAGYSGLIECPCSDRIERSQAMTYALIKNDDADKCTADIPNATDCHHGGRLVTQSSAYSNKTINDSSQPPGCFVVPHASGPTDIVWNSAGPVERGRRQDLLDTATTKNDASHLVAFAHDQINVTVELQHDQTKITLVGQEDVWFGVGFGSNTMCVHMNADECVSGGPYTIVVAGSEISERKLDFHGPGTVLEPSVTVVSNIAKDGFRTVVLTRPLSGKSPKHYPFDPSGGSVPIITAKGCGLTFAQHCGHGPSTLSFLTVDSPNRICQAGVVGKVGNGRFGPERCAPFPTGELSKQHNPTCTAQSYRGGLACCIDGQSLLDKDQVNPWPDQYLEYQLKFRFYFEEYEPASSSQERLMKKAPSHHSLVRLYWQTEAFAGEYDVSQCKEGVLQEQCVHEISSRWTVRDMMQDCSGIWCTGSGSTNSSRVDGVKIISAAPHCHAPSCLSMDLYNADTGRLLCHMEPVRGQGVDDYDEDGFLAIPPCLWGDPEEGLPQPELLSLDTTLLSIKRNNNTLGHTGEMASWQMRGIVVPKTPKHDAQPQEEVVEREAMVRVRGH